MKDSVLTISFILAAIGILLLLITKGNWSDKAFKYKKLGGILIVQLIVVAIVIGINDSSKNSYQRIALKERLCQHNVTIYLDGTRLDSSVSRRLVEEINSTSKPNYHHSAPMKPRQLLITSQIDTTHLVLREDSQNSNEFWLFWPEISTENEIMKITFDFNGL